MKITRIYDCNNELTNALNAAKHPDTTIATMASFYADCIMADAIDRSSGGSGMAWGVIGAAIMGRWSASSFIKIKTLAWKEVEELAHRTMGGAK